MTKRVFVWIAAVLLLLSLTACGGENPVSDLTEEEYLPSITPPLDVTITDCLTAAQVSEIMGVDMTASAVYEHGTWVQYLSQDGKQVVSVSMENTTVELYDAMIAGLSGGEKSALVGERAYWYEASDEVIFFFNGYSGSVQVTDPTVVSVKGLCEATAAKIVANLSQK